MRAPLLAVAAALALAASAQATTMRLATLPELVGLAHVAVRATVLNGQKAAFEGTRIVTRTPVEVVTVLAGPARPGERLEVVTLGGVVGDIGQHVEGMPTLHPGEDVVLLLARDGRGGHHPVGLWQGVFHVTEKGPQSPVVRWGEAGKAIGPTAPFPKDLATLEQHIREAALAR